MKLKIPYWPLLLVPTLAYGIGYLLNAVVVAANGGMMPVVTDCLEASVRWAANGDTVHTCLTKASHLKILADWFLVPTIGTASPGDFFEWFGAYTMIPGFISWALFIIKDASEKVKE